jgi:hypothetical protein
MSLKQNVYCDDLGGYVAEKNGMGAKCNISHDLSSRAV